MSGKGGDMEPWTDCYRVESCGYGTPCWVWQRPLDGKGYGRIRQAGRTRKAHRVVYEHHRGAIPDGMVIDHLCRNPGCVNPDHLEVVTQVENMRRARHVKLSAEVAQQIREATGRQVDIAARFGTDQGTVSAIRAGKLWVS